MKNKSQRICPCCGKQLILIPPTKLLLPNRVGVSSNFVEYYFPSNKRYFSITSSPHSHYKQNTANKLIYNGNLNKNFIKSDKSGWNIIPINNTIKKLKKDGLWIFSYEMVFFCQNCLQKLSINQNPFALFRTSMSFFFVITVIISLIFIMGVIPLDTAILISIILGIILFVLFVEVFVEYYHTIKHISNFVPTDEYDSLIYPKVNLIVRINKPSAYLLEGNVFRTELNGEQFHIYFVCKNPQKQFHICGIDGEPERLLALIREKQERGETVTLPLTFEGKFVGNAEVLETYDPPQSTNEER